MWGTVLSLAKGINLKWIGYIGAGVSTFLAGRKLYDYAKRNGWIGKSDTEVLADDVRKVSDKLPLPITHYTSLANQLKDAFGFGSFWERTFDEDEDSIVRLLKDLDRDEFNYVEIIYKRISERDSLVNDCRKYLGSADIAKLYHLGI